MQPKKYLIALAALVVVANCSTPEPEIVTVTNIVPKNIPLATKPKPVDLVTPTLYVVTKDNYEEFMQRFKRFNNTSTYIAISVKDYENLSINIGELQRYIEQQQQVIVYYEKAIKG